MFRATDLPSGLAIDRASGAITGTAARAGNSVPHVEVCFVDYPAVCDDAQFPRDITESTAPESPSEPTKSAQQATTSGRLAATGGDVPVWAIAVGGGLLVAGAAVGVIALVRRRRD